MRGLVNNEKQITGRMGAQDSQRKVWVDPVGRIGSKTWNFSDDRLECLI